MSKKTNGVNCGKTVLQKSRRSRVIDQLEKQLKRGTKKQKLVYGGKIIPLTDKDISRINRELETLKVRI